MSAKPRVAVILANLGTPDSPTPSAVRKFLKQFLSDQRVIEIPKILWWLILNLFVLPFRPKRVALAYQSVWQKDSPMREILLRQVAAVEKKLIAQFPNLELRCIPAMTYGNPNIAAALKSLEREPVDHIILLPLFPQYSATSTAPLYDALSHWIKAQRNLPGISVIRDYYAQPDFIQSLVNSIQEHQAIHGRSEKLLMSFHGIPQPYADKGDPYADRCRVTAQRVAEKLGLEASEWAASFQSRFGKQEWIKPYTSELLKEWAEQGVKSVQVLSPAFSADCLETLEELAVENKDIFIEHGGQEYQYIAALNDRSDHIEMLSQLVATQLTAAEQNLKH